MANKTYRGTEAGQIEEMPAATTPPTSSGNYYVTQPMCHAWRVNEWFLTT